MPEEERWVSFFNPDEILIKLGLDRSCRAVADIGCGYGTFTISAARRISGTVYAIDIEPQMVEACQAKSINAGLANVIVRQQDFVVEGIGLTDQTIDYVMLFNILHAEKPVDLLQEALRILVPGGKVGIIHWNYDPSTPRGPSMSIRPRPEQIQEWLRVAGFDLLNPLIDLPPYHYGIVGQKKGVGEVGRHAFATHPQE